ncbi:MAG TPA: HlyD family efflux transporter periplasmic adaptor subunit, partial [Chloroflexota bacterium]|nr:HlyD family efflux transporter periplasmic adaptor subunit [Chloroflexota bacterium]
IIAPFDGAVSAVAANVGEQVSAAAITMVDPKSARIDATVDETDVAKLVVGQPATVTFDAIPDKRLQGKVIAVAPAGTTTQGVVSYLVSIGLSNLDVTLPAGMSASLSVEVDRKDNVLVVPNRAVRTVGRNRVVDVMVGEKTETRTVQVGMSNDQSTQIVSGLQDGDVVVIPVTTTRGASGPGAPSKGGGMVVVR